MASSSTSAIRAPAAVHTLLDRLHTESLEQEPRVVDQLKQARESRKRNVEVGDGMLDAYMVDKFVALDRDKCEFVYQLLLAKKATTVIEAGTSFGVSTIYLALAMAENCGCKNGSDCDAVVIATEKENTKTAWARRYWSEAGPTVTKHIKLLEGDLLKTLDKPTPSEVDLLLLDIWTPLALPTLKLVQPKLKSGAAVIVDNSIASAEGYAELLKSLKDPAGPFTTTTLPFKGGLEFAVYDP